MTSIKPDLITRVLGGGFVRIWPWSEIYYLRTRNEQMERGWERDRAQLTRLVRP